MAWQEDRHERTEKATPRKRQEAREKGQVAKSKEVASVTVLMTGLGVFYFFGQGMVQSIEGIMKEFILESSSLDVNQADLYVLFKKTLIDIFYLLMPLLVFPVVGVMANIVQVGFLFTTKPLELNLSRVNPLEGIKKLLSFASLVEALKGVLKLLLIGYMAYIAMRDEIIKFGILSDMDTKGIVSYFGLIGFKVLLMTSSALIILAVLDYIYQRWEMERNLRMTKQEVKEEFKDTEGQPQVKARVRSLQREMARKRMMQEVPKATVVITNPSHLAVAIKYEQGRMGAPLVVAKGSGLIAERIKEVALENSVPIVENKPLAQVLYKTVEIGKEIPVSLYKAVAEVLAHIYRLKAIKGSYNNG